MIDCNKCIVQNCIFNSTTPKKSCQWYEEKKAEENSFFNFDKVIEIECNKARADERKKMISIVAKCIANNVYNVQEGINLMNDIKEQLKERKND